MKSNRMRLTESVVDTPERFDANWLLPLAKGETVTQPVDLARMGPPCPVTRVQPDQIIEDILVATLSRVQNTAAPEIAAAAARYISLLREKAI